MEANQASSAAGRISELWRTLNVEQVKEVTRTLLTSTFDPVIVQQVTSEMYLADTRFFDLSAFCHRVRFKQDGKPDPLSLPNSFESQTARRAQEDRQWRESSAENNGLRTWWDSLAEPDRVDMTELFKMSAEYARTKEFCEWSLRRGKAPLILVQWSAQQAKQSTQPRGGRSVAPAEPAS